MDHNISLVIPTLNRPKTLRETLDSYMGGTLIPAQIVVVDQTKDPVLREEIKSILEQFHSSTKLCYFHQAEASSTKARNNGFDLCEHEIVVFSDDDVTVEAETLRNVATVMERPEIAMVAGIDKNTPISASKLGFLFGRKSFRLRKIGHVTDSMLGRFPDHPVNGEADTQWAMGFFFVIRKSMAERWGLRWDENLTSYAYAEDLDYSFSYYKSAHKENLRCIYHDLIVVDHRASREWRVPSRKSTMMYILNREYLRYKHKMGLRSALMMKWCFWGDILWRLIRKQNVSDLLDAQKTYALHREEIKRGILKEEWYI